MKLFHKVSFYHQLPFQSEEIITEQRTKNSFDYKNSNNGNNSDNNNNDRRSEILFSNINPSLPPPPSSIISSNIHLIPSINQFQNINNENLLPPPSLTATTTNNNHNQEKETEEIKITRRITKRRINTTNETNQSKNKNISFRFFLNLFQC